MQQHEELSAAEWSEIEATFDATINEALTKWVRFDPRFFALVERARNQRDKLLDVKIGPERIGWTIRSEKLLERMESLVTVWRKLQSHPHTRPLTKRSQ